MKKLFSKSKLKTAAPEAAAGTSSSGPGYQLKEKDLPKLHKSAWNGDLAKIQQLSKKNDVYALDKQNRTPLHLACAKGHVNIVQFLTVNTQSSKLNLCDNDQRSALMKAVQGDFDECAEILINSKADPNLVDRDGNTALHLAADYGFVHVAILLLNNGSMSTPTNKTGSTPLHMAVSGKHDEMVEILLEGNADVNATDNENRTALMLACQADQIGMVKILLDNKADTDIKDSKGWTANDHAIMGGFHGCSHLIDEFNASRRPKASVSRPSSAGLFGSTTGSDALGFSLGGPAADNFDDDEDDLSFGKGSVVDSWNASASEAEEIPKPKPKINKPVKLSKFVQESDNESIRSGVSMRSSTSKTRIPKSVSRQGSITSERSLQSARGNTSGTRLPRPASSTSIGSNRGAGAAKPAKPTRHEQRRGSKGSKSSQRKDSWGDSAPPTPTGSVPATPRDDRDVTPRDGFVPTPRGSILSALETGSEWDDDDVLDALEDTGTRQQIKVPEQKNSEAGRGKPVQKEQFPGTQKRKAVLEDLGMSDVDDESSVAFSDEDNQDAGTLKTGVKASGDSHNVNEQNNNNKDQKPPPEDEEEDDSEWDSDGDDLLPSETDTKGPSLIRQGAISRGDDDESNTSVTPSPQPPRQIEESHVTKVDESPVRMKSPEIRVDSPKEGSLVKDRVDSPKEGSLVKDKEEEDEDEWDSEDEDLEEESEWEKGKGDKRDSIGEELQNSGHFDELNRQKEWDEEEKLKEKKLRQEADEELRREKEEQDRERKQQEEERRQLEEERKQQEEERKQLEKERAAERRRQEEQAAEDQRRREEEEAEVARNKAEIEAERKHLEETRRQEEERIQAEREQLEEQRRGEQEKRDAEQRQLEEERKKEEQRLEQERKKLEEEKRQTAQDRDEDTRKREQALKDEEKRIEAEKKRLEELKQEEQERLEVAKRLDDLERKKELQNQEEERRQLEEERRQVEDNRRRIEEEKMLLEQERKLEEERKQMEDERRKREEDRLEAERKRQEELRKQFQEDQLKMTREMKDEDEIRRAVERKHLEDERQRLEEERLEAEKREQDREEQRMEEKRQLLATQREMEDMRRKVEEEKARFEQQKKKNLDKQADAAEREKFEETMKQEQERMNTEKDRLEAENRDIEKKRKEIEAMQKQFENKNQERTLLRYQQSIEKRLEDEDKSQPSVNGVDEDNESLADISRDLEAAVVQRQQIESGTYTANAGHTPEGKGNATFDVQSLANTGDFSAASLGHQGNPLSSIRGPPASRQSPAIVPTTTSPTKALYNSPMMRSSTMNHANSVPTWQTILAEPDGLEYTSSEGEDDMLATQEPFRSSMRSPRHLAASTPVQGGLYGTPGSPLSPSTNDPTAVIRLQSMVREQKRATEREKNERLNANNQCKILQGEKAELHRRLDDVTKFKMSLDQQLLDLEAKIRGLEHELSQELERRHNSEVLLQKTKEQLKRKEGLYAGEIEAKQKTELASRNVQMDLRSSDNIIKQLEEERNELRRQLNQEKAARAIQDDIINEHRRAQEMLQEESTRIFTEKAEAVNRLEAADESRKAAMNQTDKLKTQLHSLKMQLEKQKMRHRDDQGLLVSENEELTGRIEELKSEMRVAEEALAHATMTYNAQLAAVRTENAVLHNGVEKERNTKEHLKAELDSVQKRLETTSKDLEKAEKVRTELEHELKRGTDEWTRTRDQIQHENSTMRDSSQTVAQRLGAAESRVASLENELQTANNSLMDKNNQLMTTQRDLDLKSTMQNSHDSIRQKEREDNVKLSARVETLTERLSEAQTEIGSLKRSLDSAQHHNAFKDKDASTAQDKFNNTLTSMQAETDRTRTIWEERNNALQESISRFKEELQRSEHSSSLKDQDLRKLQQELTESLLKVSITENTLEMSKKMKDDLEMDRNSSKGEIKQLTDKLSSMERERHRLESRVDELQNHLVQAERSNLDTSHQLMTTQTTLQHKSELESTIRQLEKENSRLEMGLNQESNRAGDLSRKLGESQKMVNGLESMITNIKTSQLNMEDKLSEATAAKSMFEREVVDHQQLWESEVKSRSKLGLRIAQLERAKTETQAHVEEEKKKTRKMAELKRSAEDKLQNEIQRTQQLEKEMATLRAKIKLAKRKLKDQGPPELRLSTMQTEFERERLNMEGAMGTLRRQLEDVNQQLDRESMMRLNMEKANRQLQQDVTSSKTSEKTKEKLERAKRKLEEQLSDTKHALENGYVEKGHLEKYKQEIDAKARLEINEKLEQVNAYLEEQSQAREKLEQLRIGNESEVRKELESTIDDLKHQLLRTRNGYHDAQTRKDTMEAETSKFKELYNQELQRREKMSADLERTQDKLLESQAKLNFERQRNRHIREGNLMSDTNAGMSPIKASDPPPGESIAEKVWSELDRSITRHLQSGPTDTGPTFQSDRLNNSYGATSPRGQDNSYLATLRKNYFV